MRLESTHQLWRNKPRVAPRKGNVSVAANMYCGVSALPKYTWSTA